MYAPYQPGKFLNTDRIDLVDTTADPPTVTIGGQVLPIAAPFVARIRAALERVNQAPPSSSLPGQPHNGRSPT
jgi:hypothetical protein